MATSDDPAVTETEAPAAGATMSKPEQFEIILDNPRAVYKAGSVVTGSLLLQASQPQSYTSLNLKFSGKAKVDIHRDTGARRKEHLKEKESYFKKEVRVLPRGFGSTSNLIMEAGQHQFPFTFTLPVDIPSSFECSSGHVRYRVKARLELGWNNSVAVKKFFFVFRSLDLNDYRSTRLAGEHGAERTTCSTATNMSARISIPRTGFVPGETIPVQWQVCCFWLRKIYFTIEEVSHCRVANEIDDESETLITHTTSPSSSSTAVITSPPPTPPTPPPPESSEAADATSIGAAENGDPVPICRPNTNNNSKTRVGRELVRVPLAVPTGLHHCRIIDTEHRLVLHVESMGFTCSLKVPMNITIGTTPLASEYYDTYEEEEEEREEEEEESPPAYDSGYCNSQESLPRRTSVCSISEIVGDQPPGYSVTEDRVIGQQETPM